MKPHNYHQIAESIQVIRQLVDEHKRYQEALIIIAGIKYHTLRTTAHSIAESALNNLPLPPGAGVDSDKQSTNRYFKPKHSLWPFMCAFDQNGNRLPTNEFPNGVPMPESEQPSLQAILTEVNLGTWIEVFDPLNPYPTKPCHICGDPDCKKS